MRPLVLCLTSPDEAGPESSNANEAAEVQSKEAEENGEDLPRNALKPDPQISAAYPFPEEQRELQATADGPLCPSLKLDSAWSGRPPAAAGPLQNHRPEKDGAPVRTNGSIKQEGHELSAVVQFSSRTDHASSSGSPPAQPRPGNEHVVTVKEEVLVACDGCEDGARAEEEIGKPGTASFCRSVKQNGPSPAAHKPGSVYHDAAVQEVMKLHAKVGAGLRLQAAIQQLRGPVKKPPHPLSSGAAAAASPAANLHHMNRIPSTSKAAVSAQRLHLGDKQTSVLNRTGASWVSVKSQHQPAHPHRSDSAPNPESPPYAGHRHFLRCGQCGKCFPHPSNLKAHLQTHTGERPFCCSLCGRSFTKLSNLKAHRRVHTGERPYCCAACGKRFTQKCNLKRHQRIHLDI